MKAISGTVGIHTKRFKQAVSVTANTVNTTTIDWTLADVVDTRNILYSWVFWSNATDDTPKLWPKVYYKSDSYKGCIDYIVSTWGVSQTVNYYITFIYVD